MDGLEWIAQNEKMVRKICSLCSRGRDDLVEDLYSYCLDRIQAIADTWDPEKGAKMSTHIFANLKWYLWKYMNRYERHCTKFAALEYGDDVPSRRLADSMPSIDAKEEVQFILEQLNDWDGYLLLMRDGHGYTFQEIAEANDLSKNTVRTHYWRAMERAQSLVCS